MGAEDQQKTGKAWENYHVSGRKVDVGGGGDIQICTHWNLKASFLPVKMS